MLKKLLLVLSLGAACPVAAEEASNFRVAGDTLYFDTVDAGTLRDISGAHVQEIRTVLNAHPEVTTLELNSGGGSVWAGDEIGRIVIDFELDTIVDGKCNSSCVKVFLAGAERGMRRGSKIGFHQNYWRAKSIEDYYDDERESEGWATPFEFASWVYDDTQTEVYQSLKYVISRGVEPSFAVEMHAPRREMWYPTRKALLGAGVLTH